MYQLEKQETAHDGSFVYGSRKHGVTRSSTRRVLLKTFLCELGEMSINDAVKIYEDNQGSISLAKYPAFHERTKHIDIRYRFVREKVDDNQVIWDNVSTLDMLADIMTKPILAMQFCVLRTKLGIQVSTSVESSGRLAEKAARS